MVMELAFRVKVKTVDDKQNCSLLNNLSSLELKAQYMSPTGEEGQDNIPAFGTLLSESGKYHCLLPPLWVDK